MFSIAYPKGLLVLMETRVGGVSHQVESLLQRRDTFKQKTALGDSSRLKHVDVSIGNREVNVEKKKNENYVDKLDKDLKFIFRNGN